MCDSFCVALIPAYEPDNLLLDLLCDLRTAGVKTIVVDDGSGPAYAEVFRQAEEFATVLGYANNQGKGHALKYGFNYINEHIHGRYVVVTMDADGQHRVVDAEKVCDLAEQHAGTLVLGSRKQGEGSPLRSRFGNFVTRKVYSLSTGRTVYDTQTGLRAFDAKLLPFLLQVPGERYEYEMNVLLAAVREGIAIEEVSISTIYLEDNRRSHFSAVRDSWRVYKEILKFSAVSLISCCVDYLAYTLLLLISGDQLAFANISARFISASLNFSLNRKYIFKSEGRLWQSALQYFVLAIFILFSNTVVLSLLVNGGVNEYIAKLITEIMFFSMSWLVQRFVIFRKKRPLGKYKTSVL